jgi:hypothetical protein
MSERADNDKFSKEMQPIAIAKFYTGHSELWPGHRVYEVDNEFNCNPLARVLDIGGTDKVLIAPSGYVIHLGQRFRHEDVWLKNPDFTLRESEYRRHLEALQNGGTIPNYYAYGYATEEKDDFFNFFIVNYITFMQAIIKGHLYMAFKERWENYQNNFYYLPWVFIPGEYIHFHHVTMAYLQPSLFAIFDEVIE